MKFLDIVMKKDEKVVLRAQDDESEVRYQEKQAIFEKMQWWYI